MSVSAAFQLALDIYELDGDTAAARRKVWKVLAPRLDAIGDSYVERLRTHTPLYREIATSRQEVLKRQGGFKKIADLKKSAPGS